MLKQDIHFRKVLREQVLSSLYNYHFLNNGAPYITTVSELKLTPEEKLAYSYLENKKYIEITKQDAECLKIRITADGIDAFENLALA